MKHYSDYIDIKVITCHLSELSLPELPDVGDPLDGVAEHEDEHDHEADVGQLHLPPVHEPAWRV